MACCNYEIVSFFICLYKRVNSFLEAKAQTRKGTIIERKIGSMCELFYLQEPIRKVLMLDVK